MGRVCSTKGEKRILVGMPEGKSFNSRSNISPSSDMRIGVIPGGKVNRRGARAEDLCAEDVYAHIRIRSTLHCFHPRQFSIQKCWYFCNFRNLTLRLSCIPHSVPFIVPHTGRNRCNL
jgi:hypothetical protein